MESFKLTFGLSTEPEKEKFLIEYLLDIRSYFRWCENSSVLEIGPYLGHHTDLIQSYPNTEVTLVENNLDAVIKLKEGFNTNIIHEDIFDFLYTSKKHFDVVVCCGVLYHLHSPIYLLELIVNNATPETIILETINLEIDQPNNFPNEPEHLVMREEQDNLPGMRYTTSGWKSAKISTMYTIDQFVSVMYNLGYTLVETNSTPYPNLAGKENVKLMVFTQI